MNKQEPEVMKLLQMFPALLGEMTKVKIER